MSSRSSVDRAPVRCSGGHGFHSCRGLRIFLCPTLVSCWLIHRHISLPSLKFTIFIKCTFCFTSEFKFVFKPPRLLCSFVICEFPLMVDCLMCTLCPGKISYQVSGVPLFTICRMNDLGSEFNSRNSAYNASCFTALKMSGIVLYCWWKAFIWLKLSESLLQPTLVVRNLMKQNIPAFDFTILAGNAVLSASLA